MKIAVDMQLAQGTATGIGEYAYGLRTALREAGADAVSLCEPRLDPWRFDRRVLWDQVLLPQRARSCKADLLHCTSGTMPLLSPLPAVVTVHDVAFLKVQQHTRRYARYYFGPFSLARYRAARAIVVDSQFSAAELRDVLDVPQERIHVIYPGVSRDFCALAPQRRERSIFVPGTVERRKNLQILIRALVRLPGVRLISTGPDTPYLRECRALAQSLHLADRVEFRGYVPRSEILDLYARCGVVAVPSLYEGFGYAAAQALCAGAPLLAAAGSSLPEVVGDAAPLLPPDDDAEWARHAAAILDDPQNAQERAAAVRPFALERFAWSAAAKAMLSVYSAALAQ